MLSMQRVPNIEEQLGRIQDYLTRLPFPIFAFELTDWCLNS